MNAVTFDTHAAVRKLRAADLSEQQAEALVEVFSHVVGESATRTDLRQFSDGITEHFATKADLAALETRLIKWMAGIAVAGGGLLFAALRTLG
ncbi:MAG: hypothetical protein F4X11_11445 [Acidobacteria bacterium]|nr:hypothetical protein [Acidobacteriota bacterium]